MGLQVSTCRQVVLALHMGKVGGQVAQKLLLRLLLAHHGRHLLAQVADDERVDLRRAHPLHKLINLPSPSSIHERQACPHSNITLITIQPSMDSSLARQRV